MDRRESQTLDRNQNVFLALLSLQLLFGELLNSPHELLTQLLIDLRRPLSLRDMDWNHLL